MKALKRIVLNFYLPLTLIFTQSVAQLTFVHVSDVHISDADSYVNNSDINGVVFSQMLLTLNQLNPKPDFVVASGDISNIGNSGNGMYPVMTQFLHPSNAMNPEPGDLYIDSAQTIPIYFVPGNHDYDVVLTPPLPLQSLDNYAEFVAPAADYYIDYNDAVLIFISSGWDDYRPLWDDSNIFNPEGSGLTDEQITWLRNILAAHAGKKKIIVMHHPPADALGTNADGTPNTGTMVDAADGSILRNRTALLDLCDSNHVDMVLAGHVHQNLVADREGNVVDENWPEGTRYIQTAACMYKGYRIITIDSSFVWAGKPQILSGAGIQDHVSSENNSLISGYNNSLNLLTVSVKDPAMLADCELLLSNVIGQIILRRDLAASDGNQVSISTEGFSKGMYLLTLNNGKTAVTAKVMIY